MQRAAKYVLWSQVSLYAALLVCIVLKPNGLSVNDGISYYGNYLRTFFPYAAGLLITAFCGLRAAAVLPVSETTLRSSLRLYALMTAVIAITPYAAGHWVDWAHTACGATLFSLQLVLSFWLVWRLHFAWWAILLTLTEIVSGLAAAMYLAPMDGFLLQTQAVFQVAFGILLVTGLRRLRPLQLATSRSRTS